jgi:hypothetical protein
VNALDEQASDSSNNDYLLPEEELLWPEGEVYVELPEPLL